MGRVVKGRRGIIWRGKCIGNRRDGLMLIEVVVGVGAGLFRIHVWGLATGYGYSCGASWWSFHFVHFWMLI